MMRVAIDPSQQARMFYHIVQMRGETTIQLVSQMFIGKYKYKKARGE
jgi:hypothetical protein